MWWCECTRFARVKRARLNESHTCRKSIQKVTTTRPTARLLRQGKKLFVKLFVIKMPSAKRNQPNILITGTPGVGKSTLARKLAESTNLVWREVSKLAIDNKCLEEYDNVYKCPILDEDKLLDSMESYMNEGGNIVDYHGADFFPERWFDIVFVLRTGNTILYDRLTARGYQGKKLEDNIDCEIFQTILEEAKASYRDEIVHELSSNNEQQMDDNVERIITWLEQWKKDNA